jgi:hypothetical protein
MPKQANPNPVYSVSLYFSFIPLFITAPTMLPTIIVQVFTMVPIIFIQMLLIAQRYNKEMGK